MSRGGLLVAAQLSLLVVLATQALLSWRLQPWTPQAWLVIAAGTALGAWALSANRPGNFNVHPAPRAGGRLVSDGPYRWIRHPMYSALLLAGLGVVLGAGGWSAVALATLAAVFGADLTSLTRDWSTSVLADDLVATGTRYQQPTWNYRSIYAALQNNGAYPLSTTALSNGTPATVTMRGGSAAYLRFTIAAGQNAAIQFSTLPSTVQLSLVRTR